MRWEKNQVNLALWTTSEETTSRRREKSVMSSAAERSGNMNTGNSPLSSAMWKSLRP